MNKRFTYYITLLVIKKEGVKKSFSKDPIDYKNKERKIYIILRGIF